MIVAVARSFATRCLARRIGGFVAKHPWIEVRLDGQRHLADLSNDVDCAIRVGNGDWPGLHVESLGSDPIVPVACHSVAHRIGLEPSSEALSGETLLHFVERDLWSLWCNGNNLHVPLSTRNVYFSETVMMLEAAEAGQGIAVARRSLVESAIQNGDLVALYANSVADGVGYYFCCSPDALNGRKVAAFRQWLFEPIGQDAL